MGGVLIVLGLKPEAIPCDLSRIGDSVCCTQPYQSKRLAIEMSNDRLALSFFLTAWSISDLVKMSVTGTWLVLIIVINTSFLEYCG